MAAQTQTTSTGDRYKWWVLATVVFGAFVSILDSTIVNTALPTIQAIFHADLHLASYVATGYILAAGVVVPLSAFLANRFGIKKIYLGSLAAFTIGSVLCGLAPTITWLIVFRIVQGAGGAALFPLSFSLLFSTFPQEERGKANGYFGIPVLVAPALGPTLGGYLTQYLDWRFVFFVNLPVGIIGVLMGLKILREEVRQPDRRFDPLGFLLAAAGLGLLLYGLSNLAYDGLQSIATVSGPVVVGVVLVALFVWVELRRKQPLLDVRLYRRRNFALGNIITWLATVGLFGPAFLLPQYLQVLRGLSPFAAGLLLLWQGVGSVAGTIVSGQFFQRVGPRVLILVGGVVGAIAGYALAGWAGSVGALGLLPWILLGRGIGLPLLLQPTNTSSLSGITGAGLPEATTLNVVARNVVASLATAALTNILQQRSLDYVAPLGRRAVRAMQQSGGSTGTATHFPRAIASAQALAYHDVFLITAAVLVPALVLGQFLQWSRRQATGARGRDQSQDAAERLGAAR
ncbi:MAG TPA: MDR family MFS transporter [Chloroflexota bacterium]|nr:MDR family MFS transporter [Chloroflexota bacterium]